MILHHPDIIRSVVNGERRLSEAKPAFEMRLVQCCCVDWQGKMRYLGEKLPPNQTNCL